MPVMMNRHSARRLTPEQIIERLDPLGWILNGATPKAVHNVDSELPEVGRMVGWIAKEGNRLIVGRLGEIESNEAHPEYKHQFVYSKDPKDFNDDMHDVFAHKHMLEKLTGPGGVAERQFSYWIDFEDPEKLRYYRENKILSNEGFYNLRFRPVSSLPRSLDEWAHRLNMNPADVLVTLITLDNKVVSAKVTKEGLFKVADFESETFSFLSKDDIKAWTIFGFHVNELVDNINVEFQRKP